MKILIVSNLYPPHYVGGYELRCSQVAEYLHGLGHEVRVLTSSTYIPGDGNGTELNEAYNPFPVERSLRYFTLSPEPSGPFFQLAMVKANLRDASRFLEILEEFQPDLVNWWNLEGITKTILPLPSLRHIPDVHWVEDNWLIREYGTCGEKESLHWFDFWRRSWDPQSYQSLDDEALVQWEELVQRKGIPTRPFPIRPCHVCFVSEFMRFQHLDSGLMFPSSEVIYGGISSERFFVQRCAEDFKNRPLCLLYAGYVEPNRGLHTIIEGLGLLPSELREQVQLSVAQTDPPKLSEYVHQIKVRIECLGLSDIVRFLGKVQHADMPRVYRENHVLLSATTRPEGLPMTMMEAMCAGCAVVTTGSGGAIEIADRADLPVFPKDHPVALSRLIAKLIKDRKVVYEIGKRGQELGLRDFGFARMMQRICESFQVICEQQTQDRKLFSIINKPGFSQA